MPVIEISSLSHPGVEMFCTLTEAQLRNRIEPDKGIFIVESPKVITRALDAGYETFSHFVRAPGISQEMLPISLNVVATCLSIQEKGSCLRH